MPLGLLDLSLVTGQLLTLLKSWVAATHIWDGDPSQKFDINLNGKPPDLAREDPGCQLDLYLFHVTQDKYQRNAPVTGPYALKPPASTQQTVTRVPPIPAQPLSLDLYYLLTASSADGSYVQEQQAMSIALKCFHENPFVRLTVPGGGDPEEFCLTMELETADDLGHLWLATTAALRLAAVYKVSVVFIEPPAPPELAAPATTVTLSVSPAAVPLTAAVQVLGTYVNVTYRRPNQPAAAPPPRYDLSPATVAAGQSFFLYGTGFGSAAAGNVYLLAPGAAEEDVTAWVDAAASTASRFALTVPPAPRPAGIYQLRVGNNLPAGNALAVRSNATPFGLAALVDAGTTPVLPAPAPGSPYVLTGAGFDPAAIEVLLETVPLAPHGGAGGPAPGEFLVADARTIQFQPPADLGPGTYAVRVRVNQVDSAPAKWVTVP